MKRNQLSSQTISPDQILPTPGSAETIFLLAFVLLTPVLFFALS